MSKRAENGTMPNSQREAPMSKTLSRQELKYLVPNTGSTFSGLEEMKKRAEASINGNGHSPNGNGLKEEIDAHNEHVSHGEIDDSKFDENRIGVRARYLSPKNTDELLVSPLFNEFFPRFSVNALALLSDKDYVNKKEISRKKRVLGENPSAEDEAAYNLKREEEMFRLEERVTGKTNYHFLSSVAKRFELSPIYENTDSKSLEETRGFIDTHLRRGRRTWANLITTVAPSRNDLELKNEISISPELPSDMIEIYANPNTHPSLKSQILQVPQLAFISAEKSKRDKETKPSRHLARIQNLFNEKLYESGPGQADEKNIRALLDNSTNTVKYVEGVDGIVFAGSAPENSHYITHHLAIRRIPSLGIEVSTSTNEKPETSDMEKAIRKAQKRKDQDWIDVRDVQDTHRIALVVVGGKKERDLVREKVESIISNPSNQKYLCDKDLFGRPLDTQGKPIDRTGKNSEDFVDTLKGRWIGTKDDSEPNGTKDQARDLGFKRIQVSFDGLDRDIEIMFLSIEDHLNMAYEFGEFNGESKEYSGKAHELYEIRRAKGILSEMVSTSDYPRVVLSTETHRTFNRKVKSLRNRNHGRTTGK